MINGLRVVLGVIYNIIKKYMLLYLVIFVVGNMILGFKGKIKLESILIFSIIFFLCGIYYRSYEKIDGYLAKFEK